MRAVYEQSNDLLTASKGSSHRISPEPAPCMYSLTLCTYVYICSPYFKYDMIFNMIIPNFVTKLFLTVSQQSQYHVICMYPEIQNMFYPMYNVHCIECIQYILPNFIKRLLSPHLSSQPALCMYSNLYGVQNTPCMYIAHHTAFSQHHNRITLHHFSSACF